MKRFVSHEAITIAPNRQRREHDIGAHQDLVESIRGRGLFHAPVLRSDGDNLILVAGERRLRALADLRELGEEIRYDGEPVLPGMVPYVLLGDLNELEAEEAELDENIRRQDLTWQERSSAVARLADLRRRQAEAVGALAPTVAEIHEEVRPGNTGVHTTRQEILLAKHLDKPEIAKAGSVKEAFKILKRIERTEQNAALGRSVGQSLSGQSHTIRCGDALDFLREVDPSSFDVILTDPPYGMGADTFGDSGGVADGEHFYEDSAEVLVDLMGVLGPHSYRIAKPDAFLYCFCDLDHFHFLKDQFSAAGWKVFRTPLIWYKPNGQRAPWPDAGPQRKFEVILYARKGEAKTQYLRGDVLEYPTDANLGHPAQKPVALYEDLLRRVVVPGYRVLDPFAGTGPILPAAHNLKCFATAVEQDEAAYGIMVNRLKELV